MLPLTDNLESAGLGVGFMLYFQYIFFSGILLGAMFLIVGLYNINANANGTRCDNFTPKNKDDVCISGFVINQSTLNRSDKDSFYTTSWLNFVFVIFALGFIIYSRRTQRTTINKFGRKSVTAANFTVLVKDIPLKETAGTITDFFQREGRPGMITDVKKVVLSYKVEKYVALETMKEQLQAKFVRDHSKSYLIQVEIDKIDNQMQVLRDKIVNNARNFTGAAFITVGTREGMNNNY